MRMLKALQMRIENVAWKGSNFRGRAIIWHTLGRGIDPEFALDMSVSCCVMDSWASESSAAGTLGSQANDTVKVCWSATVCRVCVGEAQEENL